MAYETGRFAKPKPDAVKTHAELVQFLRRVARDYEQSGREEWENRTLGNFLGALAQCAEDFPQTFINRGTTMPDPPAWSTIAELVYGATGYE